MSMRRVIPLFLLVLMTAYGPLSMIDIEETIAKSSGETIVKSSGESEEDFDDVPNWRIGDEWVYETGFDVAGLIAQANVSASVDTLTGDTTVEVTGIEYDMIMGTQTLVYVVDISGDFESGSNSQIEADGTTYTGKVEIEYRGTDIFRASDLGQWNQTFSLTVTFIPYFWGFPITSQTQTLAQDLEFSTIYNPPREKYDFPLRTGDQWVASYNSGTNVSGTSDYFDPNEFNTPYVEDNTSYQATSDGTPTEDQDTIQYGGCTDSHKVNNWNSSGTPGGFEWYCNEVRNYAWQRIDNPAGFVIDWKLKSYTPTDSSGVVAASNPGIRNVAIDITPEFVAILPNATEEIVSYMTVNGIGEVGQNLQLRYESEGTIVSLTTDGDGKIMHDLFVGNNKDSSNASDDWSSNGVVVFEPVNKYVGATSIVMDLSVVGIDLVANSDSMIVTRTRGNDSVILSQASGYNALPGDTIQFSVPAQNRGVLTSPATEMEITTPDGTTVRGTLPALSPYSEARVDVNWTVPENTAIGIQTLSFVVDPDNTVTADANRSNNVASLDIFIGRMPIANMVLTDNVFTFENVSIDASGSYDGDTGGVNCIFEIQDGVRTELIDAPNCRTNWSWVDDGDWEVKVTVVDDELDEIELVMYATILNRDPYVNLTSTITAVGAGSSITFDASDSGDIDTISPEGQHVTITWPDSTCNEGLYGPYCTFSPEEEGVHQIEVVVTDDDNSSVSDILEFEVLNVAPTIGEMRLSIGGIPFDTLDDGTWNIDEDVVASLQIEGDDTLSDRESLLITWYPDDLDQNWTVTTSGPDSEITASWGNSGMHTIRAFVTDNDGVASEDVLGYVRVNNIVPVLDVLPAQKALFEDEIINISASATDIADADVLIYCWDLIVSSDSDGNGNTTDDCDVEGPDLVYSWPTPGLRTITANVWDDDNTSDSFSIDVTIVNRPPTANIFVPENGFVITEGESITFNGANSTDSPTDRSQLQFIWDDPNTAGATQDGFGEEFTIKFTTPGKYFVNLTVTDDDGKTSSASVIVEVEEKPSEGLFGMTTPVAAGAILALVIAVLLGVLLLRGRSDSDIPIETKHMPDYGWSEPAPVETHSVTEQASPEPMVTESINTGPPIPATGLPEGWTMEQWSYYGEQYLASNPEQQPTTQTYSEPMQTVVQTTPQTYDPVPAQTAAEPDLSLLGQTMVQEPAPTPASQALADLLDDLDL